jgi:hypothetical protein
MMEKQNEQVSSVSCHSGLRLLDEIAFDMILKGGKFSDRKKEAEREVYPTLIEDL